MFRTSRQIVRIALVLMLLQAVIPAFIPAVAEAVPNNTPTIHVQHSSIAAPLFLQENEEKETSEFFSISDSAPILLDLYTHSRNLIASHTVRFATISQKNSASQACLLSLFCSYLI